LLRQQKWESVDIANLIEEIETLGRQERRELKNRLGILLGHLLKWQYQPELRGNSWLATIREQRREVETCSRKPSLKPYLGRLFKSLRKWLDLQSGNKTTLRNLPEICPYTLEQALDNVFPDGGALK